jgi:hypothetical protein
VSLQVNPNGEVSWTGELQGWVFLLPASEPVFTQVQLEVKSVFPEAGDINL